MRISTIAWKNKIEVVDKVKQKADLKAISIAHLLKYYIDNPTKERLKILESFIDQINN